MLFGVSFGHIWGNLRGNREMVFGKCSLVSQKGPEIQGFQGFSADLIARHGTDTACDCTLDGCDRCGEGACLEARRVIVQADLVPAIVALDDVRISDGR